jgi:hypothetical protein
MHNERVIAQALHDEWNGVGGWASLTDKERNRWQHMAKAALQALSLRNSASQPVGWRVLPGKPTDQMYVAFREALEDQGHIYRFVEAYEAMLAAAPAPRVTSCIETVEAGAEGVAPFAWMNNRSGVCIFDPPADDEAEFFIPLYAHPSPQVDEEMVERAYNAWVNSHGETVEEIMREVLTAAFSKRSM